MPPETSWLKLFLSKHHIILDPVIYSIFTPLDQFSRRMGLPSDNIMPVWHLRNVLLSADQLCLSRMQIHVILSIVHPDEHGDVEFGYFLRVCGWPCKTFWGEFFFVWEVWIWSETLLQQQTVGYESMKNKVILDDFNCNGWLDRRLIPPKWPRDSYQRFCVKCARILSRNFCTSAFPKKNRSFPQKWDPSKSWPKFFEKNQTVCYERDQWITFKGAEKRYWMNQCLFLFPLKGGRWHIIPQLAVYTTYIPLIYCLLGGYMLPTNQKQPLNEWTHLVLVLKIC